MSAVRRRLLPLLAAFVVVIAIAPGGASAAVICPQNLYGWVQIDTHVVLNGACVSSTNSTIYYDLGHAGTSHGNGTPHYPANGQVNTLLLPHLGTLDLSHSPAWYVAGSTPGFDSFQFAATDDNGGSWTVFTVNGEVTPLAPTTFNSDPTEPVRATIQTNGSGGVTLAGRAPTSLQPPGWHFIGQEFFLSADPQTAADPLRFTVTIDSSIMSQGVVTPLAIFRNGIKVPPCTIGHGTTADPDPCVDSEGFVGGDYQFVVLSSHASVWNVASPATADGSFSADVLSYVSISATPAVDFGPVSIGTTALGFPSPASATVTANVPYSLSVARTAFAGGDIPLQVVASAPSGATLDPSMPGLIPTTGSLTVGGRATGITPPAGEDWAPVYTLGPVPFRAAGATNSTVTYTVVAP